MKNLVKFLITFTITLFALFMVCTNYSLAENTTTDSSTTTSSATDSSETQITTTVSSTSSPDYELFKPTNIINILLIAVGVVIILLAIAILTKIK